MSNVFVGLQSNSRAHSRILKPPGGISSIMLDDVLMPSVDPDRMKKRNQEKWAKEIETTQNNSQNYHQNEDNTDTTKHSDWKSDLEISTNCTMEDNRSSGETTDSNTQITNITTMVETSSSSSISSPKEETERIVVKPSNQRVPPGGYSKGLW